MAQNNEGAGRRDAYRDNDDVRQPLEGDDRSGTTPDTKGEARGDARENIGNNARGTDADPTGPEGNDKQRGKPGRDSFDEEALDSDRGRGSQGR
jgi:hypothetical protein